MRRVDQDMYIQERSTSRDIVTVGYHFEPRLASEYPHAHIIPLFKSERNITSVNFQCPGKATLPKGGCSPSNVDGTRKRQA